METQYGRLYNGYAAIDIRNIAPLGWHVPSDAELRILVTFLGGEHVAGGKMKEAGTKHWTLENNGATKAKRYRAHGCKRKDCTFIENCTGRKDVNTKLSDCA